MSEANKNRNKDKGRQNNRLKKHNRRADFSEEIAEDTEFLNLDGRKNKRRRKGEE